MWIAGRETNHQESLIDNASHPPICNCDLCDGPPPSSSARIRSLWQRRQKPRRLNHLQWEGGALKFAVPAKMSYVVRATPAMQGFLEDMDESDSSACTEALASTEEYVCSQ